jgi:hypothetical protein
MSQHRFQSRASCAGDRRRRSTTDRPFPPKAKARTAHFADLAATAINNAEARHMLANRATTDELTGLPNYRSFHERLRTEVERAKLHGRELSLIVLDIDEFKTINGEHGRGVGDAVVAEAARGVSRLRNARLTWSRGSAARSSRGCCPRPMRRLRCRRVAAATRAFAREPFDIVGRVTISAGVCSLEESGDAKCARSSTERRCTGPRTADETFRYTANVLD